MKPLQLQEGTGSVRFVSVPDLSQINRFGLVRKIRFPGLTRFGLRFSGPSWRGPVRFGSFPRTVPAGSIINELHGSVRFGSVRFGSVGSVWFLIPSCQSSILSTQGKNDGNAIRSDRNYRT